MTDPFSIVAGVFGLSSLAVKLIISFSSYVDSVRGAKAEVQALSLQISTTHTALGRLKIALENADGSAHETEWGDTIPRVLEHCKSTLLDLEKMVDKAQIVETESGLERMIKTIRWNFKESEVKKYTKRLKEDKANLMMVLQVLSKRQDDQALSILQGIADRINQWDQDREGIKETFAVVDRGDPRASVTIFDRRGDPIGESPSAREAQGNPKLPQSKDIFSDEEWRLLEVLKSGRRWPIRCLEMRNLEGRTVISLETKNQGIGLVLRRNMNTKLGFVLKEDALDRSEEWYQQNVPRSNFQIPISHTLDLMGLGIRGNQIGPFDATFWTCVKQHNHIVELHTSPLDKQQQTLDRALVKFYSKSDVDEFITLFTLLTREQCFCWGAVASLFSHQTGINAEDERQVLEDAMTREMKSRWNGT